MAGGIESPDSKGPMVANDSLVRSWIRNLGLFNEEGARLVITDYRFETVGRKPIALIVPKEEIIFHVILPGDQVIQLHTPSRVVSVNPNVITPEQENKLTKDARVRRISSLGRRLSPAEFNGLLRTVKAND